MTSASERTQTRSAMLIIVLSLAVIGPVISAAATFVVSPAPSMPVVELIWALIPAVFALCGALIVWQQKGNGVGWALMTPGLASLLWLAPTSLQGPPEAVTFSIWMQIWIDGISWMLLFFPVFFLLLIFPTGRLLSPRWRIVVGLEVAMFVVLATLSALVDQIGPLEEDWTVANPIGMVDADVFTGLFQVVWSVLLMVLTVAGVTALVLRFRRGSRVERQQIKWLLLAVAIFAAVYALPVLNTGFEGGYLVIDLLLVATLIGIPVSILIAVTRYRLYEIDRLVSRTVTYALVVGILAGFVAIVAGVVGSRFQDPLLVAGTTLAVAAAFNPLRRRIHGWVDRHFNRSTYDIAEVMAGFTNSLQSEHDPGLVTDGLLSVVSTTMQPASAGLWVRD